MEKVALRFYFNTGIFIIKIKTVINIKTYTKPINHKILICVFISEITIC